MPLERVLENEVMDTLAEAADYDAMDHAQVNQVFVSDLLTAFPDPNLVLDLGTGTAQIPIELCRRHESVRVYAVDLAEEMLNLAAINIELAGMRERIRLDRIDAKRFPYEPGLYDVIASNSLLHHIAEPRQVLSEILRIATPGTRIFVRDLVRPADEATWEHLVETYAGKEVQHAKQMFADSLRAALTVAEVQGMIESLGEDPAAVRQTSNRHWTWEVTVS
ncbi:MAG: methyltransferase domain-containing protein [Pirellulaceae bacterium]|nr:methyltransferase domain-containing protein [Planctomycetales bacterium]